jgi:EpsI family protein
VRRGRPQYLLIILFLLAAHWLAFSVQQAVKRPSVAPALDPSVVPLNLDGWQGQVEELDALSKKILKPDAYLVREYIKGEEAALNLTVLFGQSKSNFHSPALCLTGEGWSIVEKSKVKVPLEGSRRPVNMTRLVLQKDQYKMLVFYTFLSPGKSDADWLVFQSRFLLARLQGRQPRGALVRLIAPVFTTEDETEKTVLLFYAKINSYLRRFLSI